MSLPPIRAAVLGYGLAGRVFHCPFIAAVPGLELAGILQRSGDSAAADYPQARIFRSVDAVLASGDIDLVIVATPNDTHFDLASRALHAGKHVVIDKPFASSSAEARSLISLAGQQGKVLAPFHNRRFDGDFLTLEKLLADGTLGRLVHVSSHFDRFRPTPRSGSWKEAGGRSNGLLFDLGPHLVDQALALFGLPSGITASVRFDREGTAIDDAFDLTLHYDIAGKALQYACHASMICAAQAPRFHVNGTAGSFVKYGLDPQEAALKEGMRPPQLGSPEAWLPEPETAWGALTLAADTGDPTLLRHEKLMTIPGDYRLFYANVRDAVRGTAALAIPSEDAFRTIKLLELALQASQERRTLPVVLNE